MVPAGRSKARLQPLTVVPPPLVIVYFPSQPEPQSDVLTKLALTPAAYAAGASHTAPSAAASAPTTDSTRVLDRFMCPSSPDENP